MDATWIDWANLLLRWAHLVTAIAWIGSSFYFVLLDSSLTSPTDAELRAKGVDGEFWAVHGGGFYHSNKYLLAPRWRTLPHNLHWSYWESYSTWLTGFALFTVLYLAHASSFLVDRTLFHWSPAVAGATALALLPAFWLAYDGLCRLLGPRRHGDRLVAVGVTVLVIGATWLVCRLFAGRAAFVIVGAMLATAMSANVLIVIIPGQRRVVAALRDGREPDPVHGRRGKQRSLHNTYFTLPVIVAMLSNHHGWLVQGRSNWLLLLGLMAAGALIRHSFVARHRAHAQGLRASWGHAAVGVALLVALAVWRLPARPPVADASSPAAPTAPAETFAAVQAVVAARCVLCHNAQLPSKNLALHTPALLREHAQAVYQQVVVLKTMPLNNATQITEAERALIARWFEHGAAVAPP
ncbi:MAG: urate hydroxylase PuuD [Rubrivivax sp.]